MNHNEKKDSGKGLNILVIGLLSSMMMWVIIASLFMSHFSMAAAEIVFGLAGGIVGWRLNSLPADE